MSSSVTLQYIPWGAMWNRSLVEAVGTNMDVVEKRTVMGHGAL